MPKEKTPMEIPITRDSSPEEFMAFLDKNFDARLVNNLIEITQADFDYNTLADFLHSDLIAGRLKKRWDYERDRNWRNRSIELAISETLGQMFSGISGDIQIYKHGRNEKGVLKEYSEAEVQEIEIKSKLINLFFDLRFREILKKANIEY